MCHSPRILSEPKSGMPAAADEKPAQSTPFPYQTEQQSAAQMPFPYPTEPQPAAQIPLPYPAEPQPAEAPVPEPAPSEPPTPTAAAPEPPQKRAPVTAQTPHSEVPETFAPADHSGRKLRIILIAANAACLVLNIVGIIFLLK